MDNNVITREMWEETVDKVNNQHDDPKYVKDAIKCLFMSLFESYVEEHGEPRG